MRTLRVDMGSVENGRDFITACHTANEDRQAPGVELIPANTACQEQNPAERYIQTYDNNEAAITISQDLLGASAWGLIGLVLADTMNHTENALTPASTPIYEFEGVLSDL
jgi:hypothetical protein